ncbi:MAG: SURF1 family protein [Comamonadaceae bacterium]|nr:SURF1 family protein [Comamonadaceae bacterium]
MAVTFSLGRWQLARAMQKEALQASIEARQHQPALDVATVIASLDDMQVDKLIHRTVSLRGVWVAERTVYLDNRQMGGRQGFDVLTPLRLSGADSVVLVQRGWAPRNFGDRTALPPVETPSGEVTITGRIASSPARLYSLGEDGHGAIRQNLDLEAFRGETGLPLASVTVLQTGEASEGLLREWTQPATGVEKHHGYAFQWFGLCTLIGLLFIWFQVVRPFYISRRV